MIDKEKIGFYRDGGLSVIENANGPKLDRLRKYIIGIFHNEGLEITIDRNLTTADFLDLTLDLFTRKYFPYRKQNDRPLYVNANSNQPPDILEQLPSMVNIRLSSLFVNEDEFNKAKPLYEKVLKSSGLKRNLKFESIQTKPSRNRKRKVVWFNPPYNEEVKTYTGKVFLKIVEKYFHKRHRFKKIFNTYIIKLSYSCASNNKNLIKQRNSSIMKSGTNTNKKDCNCRNKDNWPLDGKYLVGCIVYEATVSTTNQINTYFGSAEGGFKSRYNNHTLSFRSKGYKHRTELSKHIWPLKDDKTEFSLK